mgnify:CR=1 FL=1
MSISDLVRWNRGSNSLPVKRVRRKDDFHSRIADLFAEFLGNEYFLPADPLTGEQGFVPKVNVKDSEDSVLVSAEIPGMAEEDLDITLHGDSLIIKGEKKIEHEESEKDGYHYIERKFGSFQRVILLQEEIDEDRVNAKFKNGVLTVTLPKLNNEGSRARKISVGS